jgi:uncharacterized protein YjbI with pentapeptide repeats
MQIATIGALAFAGLPGLAALVALFFTYQQGHATDVQLQIAEQGQITDRYNAAITNLGSQSIDVRLGGIYALQRLMRDSPRDQPTVIAVLCAFVRDETTSSANLTSLASQLPTDIQAALTVVGTRNTANDGPTTVVDLDRARLTNAQLEALHLSGADLTSADLIGADLTGAHLTGAHLFEANLTKANLTSADLTKADLTNANLSGINLSGANLSGANLFKANLTKGNLAATKFAGAVLIQANLTGVFLFGEDLSDANLASANLTDAYLVGVNLHNAELNGANLHGAVTLLPASLSGYGLPIPVANLTGAYLFNANLTYANLTYANLTGAHLAGANLTGAIWPKKIPVPNGWVRDPSSGRLRSAGERPSIP